jgi:hypothetical protein
MATNVPSIAARTSRQPIAQDEVAQLLDVILAEAGAEISGALEHARRPQQAPAPTRAAAKAVVQAVGQLSAPARAAILNGANSLAAVASRATKATATGSNQPVRVGAGIGPAAPTPHTQLRLRLHKIECVTDTREVGNDEILIGGQATMLSIGSDGTFDPPADAGTVEPIALGKFRSGDSRSLGLDCGKFSLNGAAPFPRIFSVTLVLVEKDLGNSDKLVTLLKAFQRVIEDKVIEKVTQFLENQKSSEKMISFVVLLLPLAISGLIGQIGRLIGDEVFRPFVATVSMESPVALFPGGKLDSDNDIAQFSDFGGSYKVTYDFALS